MTVSIWIGMTIAIAIAVSSLGLFAVWLCIVLKRAAFPSYTPEQKEQIITQRYDENFGIGAADRRLRQQQAWRDLHKHSIYPLAYTAKSTWGHSRGTGTALRC